MASRTSPHHHGRRWAISKAPLILFTLVLATSWTPSAHATSLQPDSVLAYVPSLPANAIITAFWALYTIALFAYTARSRSAWALCLPIGTFFSCIGYGIRLLQRQDSQQGNRGIYIPMYLFVVLSPACYLAFNYIVFGRFVVAVTAMGGAPTEPTPTGGRPTSPDDQKQETGAAAEDEERRLEGKKDAGIGETDEAAPSRRGGGCFGRGDKKTQKTKKKTKPALTEKSPFSLLPPRLYTAVFVISDVVTFLIQAVGGAFQASGGDKTELGNNIFLAGVVLQSVSYLFFIFLVCWTHFLLYRIDPAFFSFKLRGLFVRTLSAATDRTAQASAGKTLLVLTSLYFSSICILVRCFYRIVEMSEGYYGNLFTNEIYADLLDALPLLLGVGIWALFWPGARETRANGGSGLLRGLGPSEKVWQVLEERRSSGAAL